MVKKVRREILDKVVKTEQMVRMVLVFQKLKRTKTEGLIDTYVVTFSDDSTFEYTVTNGKDGKNGSGSSTGRRKCH